LTPRPHSSGGKERLGYRKWAILTFVLCHHGTRPYKVAAVALANKMARIIWALLTKGGHIEDTKVATTAASAWALE
jgi:transposase